MLIKNNDFQLSSGPIMRAARKFKKLSQSEVAKAIHCSQSALSKMEHNKLIPSAYQWFQFSRFTDIPPESLELGIINRRKKVIIDDQSVSRGYKIPNKYSHYRSEKVQEAYPFFRYIELTMGEEKKIQMIKSFGLDEDFFKDFDNLINFQFFIDLFESFIAENVFSDEQIKNIVEMGQDDLYWHYSKMKPGNNLTDMVLEYSKFYMFLQCDFVLKLDQDNDKILLSYFPEYHLKLMTSSQSTRVRSFLNRYRLETLKSLLSRTHHFTSSFDHGPTLLSEVSTTIWGARFQWTKKS